MRFDDQDHLVNALWQTFLSAGSDDARFLWSLCKVAVRANFQRPALFAEVVGAALEGSAGQEATKFASALTESHYRGAEDLLQVFSAACRSKTSTALNDFCNVYKVVPKTHVYTNVTSTLWQQDRPSDAFMMHSFLISQGDLPVQFESLEPFIHHLVVQDKPLNSFLAPLHSAGASFDAQARRLWSREKSRITGLSGESLNIIASKTLGVAPRKLSDQFVARAFATRSLSFEFAVNTLRMVGLIEIGPLALRQMALTAPDLATLRSRFDRLAELGIDTGSSAFVRIIKKVCDAGRWEMIQALVNNDLHYEVFEDLPLQRQLLIEYCRTRDWQQINRTLTILCDGEFDDKAQVRSATVLVETMLQTGDWDGALNVAANLQGRGDKIPSALPRVIVGVIQDTSKATFRLSEHEDRIAFLIGMLQNASGSGIDFEIRHWRHPLRALGELGRITELEWLVYWIAEFYRRNGLYEQGLSEQSSRATAKLNILFGEKFQQSLVSWCFKHSPRGVGASPEHCLRWTRILKRLRDSCGVQVKEYTIRWIWIRCLRQRFAGGMHPKPAYWVQPKNKIPLSRYWDLYDMMWDMKPPRQVGYADREEVVLRASKQRPSGVARRRRPLMAEAADVDGGSKDKNAQGDIVIYRDMFNASWEDYR